MTCFLACSNKLFKLTLLSVFFFFLSSNTFSPTKLPTVFPNLFPANPPSEDKPAFAIVPNNFDPLLSPISFLSCLP